MEQIYKKFRTQARPLKEVRERTFQCALPLPKGRGYFCTRRGDRRVAHRAKQRFAPTHRAGNAPFRVHFCCWRKPALPERYARSPAAISSFSSGRSRNVPLSIPQTVLLAPTVSLLPPQESRHSIPDSNLPLSKFTHQSRLPEQSFHLDTVHSRGSINLL